MDQTMPLAHSDPDMLAMIDLDVIGKKIGDRGFHTPVHAK
jgi:hypothetical protein